jgi:hypothetical protein
MLGNISCGFCNAKHVGVHSCVLVKHKGKFIVTCRMGEGHKK